MNELAFKFYSVIKNEDVPPYIGEDFLVCADGLGGAGSTVHEIDREKHPNLKDELFESAFGDIGKEELEFCADYIDTLLDDMSNEQNDTSAMWASRIATVRFVYVLTKKPEGMADISSKEVREAISKFIIKGLLSVKEHFDLKIGGNSSLSLLPTTMCAIKFEEKDDTVVAESIWAGDSRCYFITADGLKSASIDDENSSGSITNLFNADEGTQTTLNYKKFEIKKPCVLMTASDGIFDTFKPNVEYIFNPEDLGVENEILSHVMKASSPSEAGTMLHDCYNTSHRGDDSTLCFVPIGFKDFDEVKATLKPRADKIAEIYAGYQKHAEQLYSISIDESTVSRYIIQRTRDKLPKIIQLLVDTYRKGNSDPVLTDELLELINSKKKSVSIALLGKRASAVATNIDAFASYLLANPRLLCAKKGEECVLNPKASSKAINDLSSKALDLVKKHEAFESRKEAHKEHAPRLEQLRDEIRLCCKQISQELIDELRGDKKAWIKKKELFDVLLTALRGISDEELKSLPKIKGISDTYSALISASNEIIKTSLNLKGKLEYAETQCAVAQRAYKTALDGFVAGLKESHSSINECLSEDAIVKYALSPRVSDEEVNLALSTELVPFLGAKDREEYMVLLIKTALQGALYTKSVLELPESGIYNEARLRRFKDYYRTMVAPVEEVKALEQEIIAIINAYSSEIAPEDEDK